MYAQATYMRTKMYKIRFTCMYYVATCADKYRIIFAPYLCIPKTCPESEIVAKATMYKTRLGSHNCPTYQDDKARSNDPVLNFLLFESTIEYLAYAFIP